MKKIESEKKLKRPLFKIAIDLNKQYLSLSVFVVFASAIIVSWGGEMAFVMPSIIPDGMNLFKANVRPAVADSIFPQMPWTDEPGAA